MFMMKCLEKCPGALRFFTGRYHRVMLQCSEGHPTAVGEHDVERQFTTLNLQVHLPDVQASLNLEATAVADLDECYDGRCEHPGCGRRLCRKYTTIAQPPQALCLQLRTFDYSASQPRRIVSDMHLNEHVTLCGQSFVLKAIVFHYGASPRSGHYAAVCRHGLGAEPFFVYNDAHRQGVMRADLASTMNLPGSWSTDTFYASALVYEKTS